MIDEAWYMKEKVPISMIGRNRFCVNENTVLPLQNKYLMTTDKQVLQGMRQRLGSYTKFENKISDWLLNYVLLFFI
jgi:hypothetical protein